MSNPILVKPVYRINYRLWYILFHILGKILCRIEVDSTPNVPRHGPFIIATNHLHLVDPVMVMLALPPYPFIHILVAEKWGRIWPINWLVRSIGGILVNRGEVDRKAVNQCLTALQHGGILGLAPEGTRSRSGVMQRGKPGVAYLAVKSNVPVLPVGVSGSETVFSDWKRLRRPTITIKIGEPIYLEPVQGRRKADQLQARSDEVMCRIAALVREDLRGVYSKTVCEAESTA
jgi:1-acyl-sn-glycerol-3-phosphate acyltransferase